MSLKKPLWVNSIFNQNSDQTQPVKKLRSSSRLPEHSEKINLETSDWIESFAPQKVSDLAVHAKKIEQLEDWFKKYEINRRERPAQICLISGPAGSGKTAAIKVLAKELKYELIEWINPLDMDIITEYNDQNYSHYQSQKETFKSFLFRSSRYKSVFESIAKRLVLVEDFPNIFIKEPETFIGILDEYSKYGRSPLVFIVTDTKMKSLNLSQSLFTENVKEKYNITNISFNAAASTLMTKAIQRICTLMTEENFQKMYKPPSKDVIDSIALSAQGDIRNALINLHFSSLKGAPSLSTEIIPKNSSTESKSSRSRSKRLIKLKSVGCDEAITMMHALGRVFNPKYMENKSKLIHQPEEIADAFATEPKIFLNFIHANYLGHFSTIENIITGADCISIADLILGEYREDSIAVVGLNIAARGVMVSNLEPVSGWMPVRGPKRIENKKCIAEVDLRKFNLNPCLSSNLFASDYRTFVEIIQSKS